MILKVNNQSFETKATTLSELATEMALPAQGVAIAVNNCMVPRAEWETHVLNERLQIIIIKAAYGG
ncbi:MAG: sulfur carrier protein ThiS [Bacteroidaceae bacterium]|nr:sulfur carrier protein ThiS [Bacteroidaceae bacterium]